MAPRLPDADQALLVRVVLAVLADADHELTAEEIVTALASVPEIQAALSGVN